MIFLIWVLTGLLFIPMNFVHSIQKFTVRLRRFLCCYVLLTAYHATIYDHGNKNLKIQSLLDRSWQLLGQLSASLLKCQLLVACYSEVFDEDLAREAHAIMNSWTGREWTKAECEVSDYLESLEANPWPDWEVVE